MKSDPIISVVVPVYRSSGILPELVKRISLSLADIDHEIILADDCSPDESWKVIKSLAQNLGNVHGIRLGKNAGQFMTTLAGISKARGKYIVTIDDDLEYDPEDILKLYSKINSGDYYLVFGMAPAKYRMQHKNPFVAGIRNRFINFVWKKFLTDSFRIFHRNALFDQDGKFASKIHFEAFVNHYLSADRVAYEEVSYHPRFEGTSNHSLSGKIQIFLRYSIEYYPFPAFPVSVCLSMIFIAAGIFEFLFFHGELNRLLTYSLSLASMLIAMITLIYTAHIYRETKNLPAYWIIETTTENQNYS